MLGGIAPVLVFNFATVSTASILNKFGFNIGEDSIFNFNIPFNTIPVYLDEKLTGIIVDDHERTINIEFERDVNNNFERVISSDVKVTVIAKKDNVAFQGFLALFEQILKKADYQAYKLYFYYDDVFMTNASLKDFAVTTRENTDTRVVTFTLTNRAEESIMKDEILKKIGKALGEAPK